MKLGFFLHLSLLTVCAFGLNATTNDVTPNVIAGLAATEQNDNSAMDATLQLAFTKFISDANARKATYLSDYNKVPDIVNKKFPPVNNINSPTASKYSKAKTLKSLIHSKPLTYSELNEERTQKVNASISATQYDIFVAANKDLNSYISTLQSAINSAVKDNFISNVKGLAASQGKPTYPKLVAAIIEGLIKAQRAVTKITKTTTDKTGTNTSVVDDTIHRYYASNVVKLSYLGNNIFNNLWVKGLRLDKIKALRLSGTANNQADIESIKNFLSAIQADDITSPTASADVKLLKNQVAAIIAQAWLPLLSADTGTRLTAIPSTVLMPNSSVAITPSAVITPTFAKR